MEFMKFFYRHKKATAKDNVLDGVIQSINKLVFPRGIKHLEKETQLLQTLLDGRYSFEDVENTFLYISAI